MTKLYINDGTTDYDLSDNLSFFHTGSNGFGLPEITRLTQQGPYQNGVTDVGFRLNAKIILLTLYFQGMTQDDYFALRRTLTKILRPRYTPLHIKYVDSRNFTYQIDGHYIKGAEFDSNDRTGLAHKVVLQLSCPNPLWYDPAQKFERYGIDAGGGSFTVPTVVPTFFGGSVVNQTKVITYNGDWQTNPEIQIKGPITDPVITNLTTNQKLDFTGSVIGSGSIWTIDTRYGYKTVVDENGVNKIAALTYDSDLSDFHLAADDESPGGLNEMQVTGTFANGLTDIYIRYYEYFTGI